MDFRNAAEPYEEQSQAEVEPTSPDMLKAFYQEMEKKEKQELLERKASKRKSNIWRNKTLKRSTTTAAPPIPSEPEPPLDPSSTSSASNLAKKQPESRQDARETESLEQIERNDSVTSLPPSRSIIPDTLKELPAWYTKDDWSSTTSFRVRFPIHNPVGPRYYRNHHLIPPSMYRPGARPPSIFSPSFPAMGTNSLPERLEEPTRVPGPSRTPSHSPLPTPSSSQTRVADLGIKPRSRKSSQTAHDPVDMLDVSDPWGTNWHHESPYDIGLGSSSSSPVAADAEPSRSRHSSTTTQARRKTVTPSPLSQSTSAIHLQVSPTEGSGSRMPRKLSKRRGLSGIFGSHSKSHQPTSHSLPTSPIANAPAPPPPPPPLNEMTKRASTIPPGPPPSNKAISAIKKERRGSILGRLTKRFSVTRKQPGAVVHDGLPHTDDHSADIRSAFSKSTEKITKRVPPPSIDNIQVDEIPFKGIHDVDQRSSISLEAPFPVGKLMVANPDAPSSEISTPPQVEALLPVHQTDLTAPQPLQSTERLSSNGRSYHSNSSPPISSSSSPPVQAQNSKRKSIEQPPVLNGHVHIPEQKASSRHGHSSSSTGHSQRHSLDDKPLPKPSERVSSPVPLNARRSEEHRRPRSPERGPPPPSSTTKPIPLPNLSDGPPPPSATTKPIPLPADVAPYPPSATTKPISLPNSTKVYFPSGQPRDDRAPSHLSVIQAIVEESPASNASILANPPTPVVADDAPIPSAPPPPIRKSSSREPSREPSPGVSSVTARETETFKLVRTKSGNVMTVSETIPAAGEQWEVEEVSQSKRASKSKDKDKSNSSKSERDADGRERDARRESRRQEKKAEVETESDRRGKRSSRSHTRHSVDDLPVKYSDKPIGRSSSLESHHRAPIPESMRQQDDARSGRVRNGEHKSSRKTSASASPTKPSTRPRERTSSKSSRPTSEVPSAADLNALRAREAWDMERLYKGRSMYGMDANVETMAPAPPVPVPSTSMPNGSTGPSASKHGAIHGSSHTSFVVQNSQIYHSMPTQPPPIIYASTNLPSSQASVSSPPPPDFFPRAPNPLPEPPRETPTPPRISQTFSDNKNGRPTEYWTTYAEVH